MSGPRSSSVLGILSLLDLPAFFFGDDVIPNPHCPTDPDALEAWFARAFPEAAAQEVRRRKKRTVDPDQDKYHCDHSAWMVLFLRPSEARLERLKDKTSYAGRMFRRMFRMNFGMFLRLVELVAEEQADATSRFFTGFGLPDATGTRRGDLGLYVLGVLYTLGRHQAQFDLYPVTYIKEAAHNRFFHDFVKWFRIKRFPELVRAPDKDEMKNCMFEYAAAGFPGCFGSVDSTSMWHLMAPAATKISLTGKEHLAVYRYQIVVDHKGRILHVTKGFKGTDNDITIAKFDEFLVDVRTGKYDGLVEYELFDSQGGTMMFTRPYLICDGGYTKEIFLITGEPLWSEPARRRWTKMLESLRKDVECCNGKLKARWRILQSGCRFHSAETCDDVFLTCCAMHNWILQEDGLDANFTESIPLTEAYKSSFPELFTTLATELSVAMADLDALAALPHHATPTEHRDYHKFRLQLITHFNYLFASGKIVWPKRRHAPTEEIRVE